VTSIPGRIEAIKTYFREVWGGVVAIIREKITEAVGVVNNMVSRFKEAGANIVNGIADGIMSAIGVVKDAIGKVAEVVAGAWPKSPPQWGPLSDIMDYGGNMMESIASGITPGPITSALGRALSPVQSQLSTTTGGGSTGGAGAISINFAPVINAGAGADVGAIREVLEQQVEQILQQIQQNQRRVSYG
jgi:phage-related protein